MKALIQRVKRSSVFVDGERVGETGHGCVVFLGVRNGDSEGESEYLAERTAALRIFPDGQGRMNRSIVEAGGRILVVSQFTLHADTRRGNRPSFMLAAPPGRAEALYERYVDRLRRIVGRERVATGLFQASMLVELVNDGPVTIELRSRNEN